MGGPEPVHWLADLEASFEAAVAREEEVAADDLALSLRQDGDLRMTMRGRGWVLIVEGERGVRVEEVGVDYLVGGTTLVPAAAAFVRSGSGPAPVTSDRTFLEILGSACRSGAAVEVSAGPARAAGYVVKVGRDHLVLRCPSEEAVIGLGAIDWVRFGAPAGAAGVYSDSRGFSG